MDIKSYQNDTYERISKFLKDIKVDLIKKISCKYKLDEKLIIRDFINNEWESNDEEKNNPVITHIKKEKAKLSNNELCRAKKSGDTRCTRRCQVNKKYCGTHLKQIENNGNLKYGDFNNSDDSDADAHSHYVNRNMKDICETNVFEIDINKTDRPKKDNKGASTSSSLVSSNVVIKANHIKFSNGLEILHSIEDNCVYDKIDGLFRHVGELIEESDDNVKIIYNDYFISNFINIEKNLFDGDNKHVGVLNPDKSITYSTDYLHYLKGTYNF